MDLAVQHQLHAFQIARPQQQIPPQGLTVLHQHAPSCSPPAVQRRAIQLRLRFLRFQRLDHRQLPVRQLGRQRRAQRTSSFLRGNAYSCEWGTGPCTVPPCATAATESIRYAPAPCPSASTASCPIRRPLAVLRRGRALAQRRRGNASPLPTAEPHSPARRLIGQLQRADLLASEIHYINLCHRLLFQPLQPLTGYWLPAALFPFAAAFFEAFSGSTVPPPANPRRSRGGAFDF